METGQAAPQPATPAPSGDEPPARPLPWRGVTAVLVGLSAALVALSLAVPPLTGLPYDNYDGWLRRYLDVGRESNLPTWWNSSLHLLAAGALTGVGLIYARTVRRVGLSWLLFALLLLAFSADEATLIHDRARHLTNLLAPENEMYYAWLGVGIPVAVAVLVVAFLSARRLPDRPRRLLLWGLGIFFLGAVGVESLHAVLSGRGDLEVGFVWVAIYHVEEFLEMAGVSLVLAAPLAAVRYRFCGRDLVLEPTQAG